MKSMRDKYAFEFHGQCLGELVPHGAILYADPREEIRPMDLVSVLLDGLDGPWAGFVNSISGDGFCGVVKLFLGVYEAAGEAVGILGQLNPPTIALIPYSHLAAIDKVVGGDCPLPDEKDRAALALLMPFAGIGMASACPEGA